MMQGIYCNHQGSLHGNNKSLRLVSLNIYCRLILIKLKRVCPLVVVLDHGEKEKELLYFRNSMIKNFYMILIIKNI